jgi:hypothetical protein
MPTKLNYYYINENKDIEHSILNMIEENEKRGPRGVRGSQGEKGKTGERGLNLDFDMLTDDEKEELKGETGIKGDTGDNLKWNNLSRQQILELGDNIVQNMNEDTEYNILDKIEGDKGDKGEKGQIGIRGFKGDKGLQGPIGQKGIRGYSPLHEWVGTELRLQNEDAKGEMSWGKYVNLIGNKGQKGIIGPKGIQGIQGFKGNIGIQGIKGLKGEIGGKGNIGLQGEKGLIGPKGIEGKKGSIGQKGQKGSNLDFCYEFSETDKNISNKCYDKVWAESGCKGPYPREIINKNDQLWAIKDNAKEIYNYPLPTSNIGLNLEYYQTKCYSQGSYTKEELYSLKRIGPKGIKGETGEKGDTGNVGPQGNTGQVGLQGLQGISGPQGLPGKKGDKGNLGSQGYTGPMGPQGLEGSRGEIGKKGDNGKKGDIGLQGIKGDNGDNLNFNDLNQNEKNEIKGVKGEKGEIGLSSSDGSTTNKLIDELADSLLGIYNLTPYDTVKDECRNNKLFDTRRNDSNDKFISGTSKGLDGNVAIEELNKCMFNWDYVTCKDNNIDKIGNNNTISKTTREFNDKKLLDYRGCENKYTVDNVEYTCKNWQNEVTGVDGREYDYVGNHNYFRNPDGKSQPWCFKTPYTKDAQGFLGRKKMWRDGNEGYKKIMKNYICQDNNKQNNVYANSETIDKCYNSCVDDSNCNYFRFNKVSGKCYKEENLDDNNQCTSNNGNPKFENNTETYQIINLDKLD